MSSVGNRSPEMFLQRLILLVNGGKVGSAYETGFYRWCSSITTVMLEKNPTGFHYGPPLTIRGFEFSQFRAKDYTEGIQYMSYKRF